MESRLHLWKSIGIKFLFGASVFFSLSEISYAQTLELLQME